MVRAMEKLSERHQKRVLIRYLYEKYQDVGRVANELKMAETTVRRWINRETIADNPRSGRSAVITGEIAELATRCLKESAGSSIRSCKRILEEAFPMTSISRETVRIWSRRQPWGTPYKIQKVPMISERNRNDRISFAKFMKAQGYASDDFESIYRISHVMFTDESPIDLNPEPNKQNYRYRTDSIEKVPSIKVPKFGMRIMVAAGITAFGKTDLIIVDEGHSVDAKYYAENILPTYLYSKYDQNLFPEEELAVLQQDGAPAHTEIGVLSKIREFYGDGIWSKDIWPGNSPDLNLIENLWSILQERIFDPPRPRNRSELIERVKVTWESIPSSVLSKLYASFYKRIDAVLASNGSSTSY